MKILVDILYKIYQLFIGLPILVLITIITALEVGIGTTIGNGHFWGYYPGRWWAKIILKVFLIPVKVEGRENLEKDQSYVFVANHQGSFDIFLIYGHLGRNFKWMMKQQLRKIPFVGYACAKSHQIFVDKRGPSKIRKTYEDAREILKEGYSVTVFPEGARTFTGHMGEFKKGAAVIAAAVGVDIVPVCITGAGKIYPIGRRFPKLLGRYPLTIKFGHPVSCEGKTSDEIMRSVKESILSMR